MPATRAVLLILAIILALLAGINVGHPRLNLLALAVACLAAAHLVP